MDLSGISAYTDYIKDQSTSQTRLQEAIDGKDYSKASDEELMEACKQFEAYFLEQVFKEMQKTVDCLKSDSTGSNSMVDFFKDNALQELASVSTETQGLGLAQTLFEQMKRNYNL